MSDRFTGQPRGRALSGAKEIAGYIWNDPELSRSVYGLDRDEYGIVDLAGKLTGFTGWIDVALARRVGKRRRRARHVEAEAAATGT